MTGLVSAVLYGIIIMPLETVCDWLFSFVRNCFPQSGVIGAIAGVSIGINILALPLYGIADRIKERERAVTKGLGKWVAHIRHTFKGDERFMMLSELYRQNGYHPVYALRGTLSVLIQIPFFIAAYHYLRNNDTLSGVSFLFVRDLGTPDALCAFNIAGHALSLNILPVLMTAVNVASGILYTRDAPMRDKVQVYVLAVVFFVLLYDSPSGLVIYWTLNNVFSLVKNFIRKPSHRWKLLRFFACLGIAGLLYRFVEKAPAFAIACTFHVLFIILFAVKKHFFKNLFFSYAKTWMHCRVSDGLAFVNVYCNAVRKEIGKHVPDVIRSRSFFFVLFLSGVGLALLCGLMLPSSIIATSPIEFSFLGETPSPLSYLPPCFCVFFGLFLFWPSAIYLISGRKVRGVLPPMMFAFFVCALFNGYVFKAPYGNLDAAFNLANFDVIRVENPLFVVIPLELLLLSAVICMRMTLRGRLGVLNTMLFACSLGMTGLSVLNIQKIGSRYEEYVANLEKYGKVDAPEKDIMPVYHLSKTGKNVLVLFLDRGIGPFAGEIFEAYPEIKKQFGGFVWYPNTVSFSTCTVYGAPAMYGGYEYTQEQINARADEKLRIKNTESQLVLPKLFLDAGFSAVLTDPSWPNYRWSGDLSGYARLPELDVREIEGMYYENFIKEKGLDDYNDADILCHRQIINFSILQILFPNLRFLFYKNLRNVPQRLPDNARAWLSRFSHLYYLPELTDFTCMAEEGAFVSIHSMAAHDVCTPADDFETPAEYQVDYMEQHHLADIAAFKQFGKLFDYLRENECYDNTRIIIVSDHGCNGSHEKQYTQYAKGYFASGYSAMLLFKDFGKKDSIVIDDTFMTNADTIFLAKEGLKLSDENPYTGKKLVRQKDGGVNVYLQGDWNAENFIEATQFDLDKNNAWHISDNIYKEENWIPLLEWEKTHGGAQ